MTSSTGEGITLAGDIGGTKTSLALYRPDDSLLAPFAQITVKNNTVASFEEIIDTFLKSENVLPATACFGVAGPINKNHVRMTNLNWILDGNHLQQRFNIQTVTLINDLVTTAFGAIHLPQDKLLSINKGKTYPVGAVAVIAPGTGLGEAFLVRHNNKWLPFPSEGGHCSFAPTDEKQRKLLQYMTRKQQHVSTEMVCSGLGIPTLYDFICWEHDTKNHLKSHPGATKIIAEEALAALANNNFSSPALQAMQLFTSILASEASNLTLKILATGGLFIGGGIPPRILPLLQPDEFMHSFARGKYRELLATIPVHVILEPQTALIGAAAYGQTYLHN